MNRLSQPKSARSTNKEPIKNLNDFDETPVAAGTQNKTSSSVVKKEPLKYGLTKAHRMRVLASRPDLKRQTSIDAKHELLLQKVKSNLDNLSLTSSAAQNEEIMHKNLEKVLFDTAESTWNNSATVGSVVHKNTRSPMNLSLLNRVEMESTYNDTVHNTVLLGQYLDQVCVV